MRSNYAINPIAEQALRPNQTIVPQRLIAAFNLMKKIAFLLVLVLLGFAIHFYYVFRPIEGIDVSEMAISLQSPIEKYEYHRHLRLLLSDQKPDSLRYLINARCDGEGAYDHGRTLVQVLIKLDDATFSEIISKLTKTESDTLLTFLSAGHEYGGFSEFPDWEEFERRFPLTFRLLREKI